MEKNSSIEETNPYSNKNTINNLEKKYSFHTIENPLRHKYNISNTSMNSKDISLNSYQISSSYINDLEQSMLELKNFIEIVAPSNSQTIETVTNQLSFRPKNLPKKSKEEEEYHRKLVEENRKLYLESLNKKHIKEMEYKKRLEKNLIKQQKLAKVWQKEIIPNWLEKKKDKKINEYFYSGLPPSVRGTVWMLCLGNKFSVTKEYYEIQVNNSREILKKYQNQNKIDGINKDNNIDIEKIDDEIIINEDDDNDVDEENVKKNKKLKDKEKSINIIEFDIERTFPYLGLFKGNSPMAEDLREILRVFVISRPDIGYIQGLSFIAGILLLNMDKFKAFISLMNLVLNPALLPFYKMDNESIQQRLKLFKQVFYHKYIPNSIC